MKATTSILTIAFVLAAQVSVQAAVKSNQSPNNFRQNETSIPAKCAGGSCPDGTYPCTKSNGVTDCDCPTMFRQERRRDTIALVIIGNGLTIGDVTTVAVYEPENNGAPGRTDATGTR